MNEIRSRTGAQVEREIERRLLVDALGLTGSWQTMTKVALLSRDLLPAGTYFLHWSRYAIIWIEYHETRWVSAHHSQTDDDGPDQVRRWMTVFRAMQAFPHRQALLHVVGFDVWKGSFGLMELIPTQVGWEWNR